MCVVCACAGPFSWVKSVQHQATAGAYLGLHPHRAPRLVGKQRQLHSDLQGANGSCRMACLCVTPRRRGLTAMRCLHAAPRGRADAGPDGWLLHERFRPGPLPDPQQGPYQRTSAAHARAVSVVTRPPSCMLILHAGFVRFCMLTDFACCKVQHDISEFHDRQEGDQPEQLRHAGARLCDAIRKDDRKKNGLSNGI